MKSYEALIIFPTTIASGTPAKNIFEDIIKKNDGKIISSTELGKRLLGYVLKKQKEGNFISFVFELNPDKVETVKRALHLAEEILRFTIVIWKKPAPIPQRPIPTTPKRVPSAPTAHAGERR